MAHNALRAPLIAGLLLLAGCRGQDTKVSATWGLDVIDAAVQDKRNVALSPEVFDLAGFVQDVSEYRVRSVRRTKPQGHVAAKVPAAGEYYPGVVIYDGAGDERLGIFVHGVCRGTIAATADDNRQYLFFLNERLAFRGGEKIELRPLTATGNYRIERILLLREKPAARQHRYAFSHASVSPSMEPGSDILTWITNWAAACTVEWRGPTSGGLTEDVPMNNHRAVLRNLRLGNAYEYRILARTREGDEITTGWTAFRADPLPTPTSPIARARVPLTIGDPDEPGRPGKAEFPVTSGIPFPKGALGSSAQVRLLDAAGNEPPLQAETLARWDDGTVKWLLIDTQANARPADQYTLEYGSEVRCKVPRAISVTEKKDGVTVDTGPLRFTIGKGRFGFIESLYVDGQPVLSSGRRGSMELTTPDGTVYSSLNGPAEVNVELRGPMRAVIRATGRHVAPDGRKLFTWTVRFQAFAGQRYLRVQHTLENDFTDDTFQTIRSLTLHLPLGRPPDRVRWRLSEASGTLAGAESAILKQHTDNRYTLAAAGKGFPGGRRASGYAEWSDGTRSIALSLRDFWQSYPKDIKITAEGVDIGLCPELRSDEYREAAGTVDEHRLFYYLQGGFYKLHQGVSKTHDLWLDFAKGAPRESIIPSHTGPLLATAPAAWYAASRALGEIATPTAKGILAEYDNAFARSCAAFLKNRETNREFGMLNFGDWWGERIINWGNGEYDTTHSFLLQCLRTGNSAYFRTGEQAEWHTRDVDTVHHHRDPQVEGGVWAHAIGHTGDYYTERPRAGAPQGGFAEGSPRSHMAADHTFVEGHFDYYFLTGDRRSLETATHIVDRYDSYFTRNYDFNNCRQPGWHLIMSMAAYNATYDAFYLNAARLIVERVLERQTADGGWQRELVPGHCYCTPRHRGNAGFMVGVLLTGLKYYYEATHDEKVADAIVRGARFLVNDMWVPEAKGFHYTSCPNSRVSPIYNFRLFDGIVFAYRRTGDPKLREVLVAGTAPAMRSMNGSGKEFTQQTRVTPHFINDLVGLIE